MNRLTCRISECAELGRACAKRIFFFATLHCWAVQAVIADNWFEWRHYAMSVHTVRYTTDCECAALTRQSHLLAVHCNLRAHLQASTLMHNFDTLFAFLQLLYHRSLVSWEFECDWLRIWESHNTDRKARRWKLRAAQETERERVRKERGERKNEQQLWVAMGKMENRKWKKRKKRTDSRNDWKWLKMRMRRIISQEKNNWNCKVLTNEQLKWSHLSRFPSDGISHKLSRPCQACQPCPRLPVGTHYLHTSRPEMLITKLSYNLCLRRDDPACLQTFLKKTLLLLLLERKIMRRKSWHEGLLYCSHRVMQLAMAVRRPSSGSVMIMIIIDESHASQSVLFVLNCSLLHSSIKTVILADFSAGKRMSGNVRNWSSTTEAIAVTLGSVKNCLFFFYDCCLPSLLHLFAASA